MKKVIGALQAAVGVRSWGCGGGSLRWFWVMYHKI
jgi:hypothetical protein